MDDRNLRNNNSRPSLSRGNSGSSSGLGGMRGSSPDRMHRNNIDRSVNENRAYAEKPHKERPVKEKPVKEKPVKEKAVKDKKGFPFFGKKKNSVKELRPEDVKEPVSGYKSDRPLSGSHERPDTGMAASENRHAGFDIPESHPQDSSLQDSLSQAGSFQGSSISQDSGFQDVSLSQDSGFQDVSLSGGSSFQDSSLQGSSQMATEDMPWISGPDLQKSNPEMTGFIMQDSAASENTFNTANREDHNEGFGIASSFLPSYGDSQKDDDTNKGSESPVMDLKEDSDPLDHNAADENRSLEADILNNEISFDDQAVSGSEKNPADDDIIKSEAAPADKDDIKADKDDIKTDNAFADKNMAKAESSYTDKGRTEAEESFTDKDILKTETKTEQKDNISTENSTTKEETIKAEEAAVSKPAQDWKNENNSNPQKGSGASGAAAAAVTGATVAGVMDAATEINKKPIYERNIYKTPPIYSNQKPIARTLPPTDFDPEKAEVLERASSRSGNEKRSSRSLQRNERRSRSSFASERRERKAEEKRRYSDRSYNDYSASDRRGSHGNERNMMNAPSEQYDNSPQYGNQPYSSQQQYGGQPYGSQQQYMNDYQNAVQGNNYQNTPASSNLRPQNAGPNTYNNRNQNNNFDNGNNSRDYTHENDRRLNRDADGRLRDQSHNRRSTDRLIFGVVPRATMSLIFLIALIAVTGIFSVIKLDVTIPILIIIMIIEVVMGVFLSQMPSFVSILVAAGLTVAGALTGFLIPVCIGNAVMLSAGLVMKGE